MLHKKLSGLILELRPHRDLDRQIILFSEEEGIVSIIAKGVRKITSHRGFHLDVLNDVSVEVEESRQRIRYLREIQTNESFVAVKRDPARFASACLMTQFVNRVMPMETPQRNMFELLHSSLNSLAATDDHRSMLLAYFLNSLELLGFLPKNIPQQQKRRMLQKTLEDLDPQFTLNARRTLGTFSKFESTRTS